MSNLALSLQWSVVPIDSPHRHIVSCEWVPTIAILNAGEHQNCVWIMLCFHVLCWHIYCIDLYCIVLYHDLGWHFHVLCWHALVPYLLYCRNMSWLPWKWYPAAPTAPKNYQQTVWSCLQVGWWGSCAALRCGMLMLGSISVSSGSDVSREKIPMIREEAVTEVWPIVIYHGRASKHFTDLLKLHDWQIDENYMTSLK